MKGTCQISIGFECKNSYDKVIDIKKDIAANIFEKSKEHVDGIFLPSPLINNERTFFANTDTNVEYSRWKRQLHRTAITVYQQQVKNQTKVFIIQVLYLESQANSILGLISPNFFKFVDNYLLFWLYGIYSI